MKAEQYNRRQIERGRMTHEERDHFVVRGIESLQQQSGLDVDGKAGPNTLAALRAFRTAPIPQTKKQLQRLVGDFAYTLRYKARSDGSKRYAGINIDPDWVKANIVTIRLHTGQERKMHRSAAAEFAELFEKACTVSGYTPRSVQTFVPRHKNWNPKSTLSLHAYGLAVDFDPSLNQMYNENARIYSHPEFIQVFRDAGWIFGGDFRYASERKKERRGGDPMHFQRAGRRC